VDLEQIADSGSRPSSQELQEKAQDFHDLEIVLYDRSGGFSDEVRRVSEPPASEPGINKLRLLWTGSEFSILVPLQRACGIVKLHKREGMQYEADDGDNSESEPLGLEAALDKVQVADSDAEDADEDKGALQQYVKDLERQQKRGDDSEEMSDRESEHSGEEVDGKAFVDPEEEDEAAEDGEEEDKQSSSNGSLGTPGRGSAPEADNSGSAQDNDLTDESDLPKAVDNGTNWTLIFNLPPGYGPHNTALRQQGDCIVVSNKEAPDEQTRRVPLEPFTRSLPCPPDCRDGKIQPEWKPCRLFMYIGKIVPPRKVPNTWCHFGCAPS
jgi:hypothetical protein